MCWCSASGPGGGRQETGGEGLVAQPLSAPPPPIHTLEAGSQHSPIGPGGASSSRGNFRGEGGEAGSGQ